MKLKKLALLFALSAAPAMVLAWPWSTDMMNQPSVKPQEGPPAAFPKRSIPVGGIPTTVASRDETMEMKNPVPVTAASIKQGRNLFKIYCAACHGMTGKADSPISPKIGAADLTADYIQGYTDGWIWGTITFGSAIMPAYGKPGEGGGSNDLNVEERWHVVNYVKNQLLKDAAATATAQAN